MKYTGYLIFEICKTCNLGDVHTVCPNKHPERFSRLEQLKTLPIPQIARIAKEMHEQYGFRGRIGFHYYNEPLMAEKRLWSAMDAIDAAVDGARYTLWTNGTRWPKQPDNLKRFDEVHLTDYRLPEFPVDLEAWRGVVPKVNVHHWPLDGRLNLAGQRLHHPCRRMFTEFVIDYFGNVHLCCYDWQGLGSPGNVQTTPLDMLVGEWQSIRDTISGTAMRDGAPDVCLTCNMRSTGLTRFVPEIAEESDDYVRGLT
jgi:hypothetical protein